MKERFELKFDDKNNLIVYKWSNPDRPAIGCVQISHGLSEHITRYEDFANFLVSKGFTVIGDDHYQHGESCKDLSKLGKVEEYDFIDAMIKSLHLVREEFANDFQGITCLFSHSMGSITAQEYIQKYPNDFQKVILSGTDVGDLRYLFLQWITSLSIKKNDCITSSKFVHNITFGNFQKKFSEDSKFNWLSKNMENIKKSKKIEIERISNLKRCLYEDWKNEYITKEEYLEYKQKYEKDIKRIKEIVENLDKQKEKQEEIINGNSLWIENFKVHKNITELDRDIITELIDYIEIHEDEKITIHFMQEKEPFDLRKLR